MGLMDKVRAQGSQLAQVAQDAAREGKVKLDQAQAKRRADALFRDLGAAVYAERTGRGSPDSKDRIDRLVDALSRQEADQGLGETDGKGSAGASPSGADGPPGAGPPGESRDRRERDRRRGPGRAGPPRRGPGRAGPPRRGPGRAGPARAGPRRATPGRRASPGRRLVACVLGGGAGRRRG